MRHVVVYADARPSDGAAKQALIFGSIELALDAIPHVDREVRPLPAAASSPPGLRQLRPHEAVIALGRAAHRRLADTRKQAVFAEANDDRDDDVESLVWSCVNTTKLVALGDDAWRSVQVLPVRDRRFFETPPLRMAPVDGAAREGTGKDVLVIDHEAEDESCASEVAGALAEAGYDVQVVRASEGVDGGWRSEAAIHVHVGHHDGRSVGMRLVDTWHSRRFAIQYLPRGATGRPTAGALTVDAEHNGFLCGTPAQLLAACADLRADPILRKKLLHAGAAKAAPLAQLWLQIARELVS